MKQDPHRTLILLNTGSPLSPSLKDVKEFLSLFLMDERVISLPKLWRTLLVKGIIVPFRTKGSAKKYQAIWQTGANGTGSPLQINTHLLAQKVEDLSGLPTLVAMRYNHESAKAALDKALALGSEEAVVVPLFPHYAMSSFESAVAHIYHQYQQGNYPFALKVAPPYYNTPPYIQALAEQVVQSVPPRAHLLFSYHGIPVAQTEPYLHAPEQNYPAQCQATTQALMAHPLLAPLQLTHEEGYQSRLGRNRWLTPETFALLQRLAHEEHKAVAIISPSFICDGLETLEELAIRGRATYTQCGGSGELIVVPCPNHSHTMARAIIDAASEERTTSPALWVAPQG